jgi:glycosyltransferase involved in cell wall biosynthesis
VRVAYFYPWIFCKGGAERVILETLKRTEHDFDIFTFCYDKEGTFPELKEYNITELTHLDVRGVLSRGAKFGLNSLIRKIPDLKSYDVFNIGTAGIADLMAIRNNKIPILCFCHTILRPVHEMYSEYKSTRFKGWKKLPFIFSANAYKLVEKMAWKNMDLVLCNSQNTKNRVLNAKLIDQNKVDVLNPGVDTKRFRSGRHEKYFLTTGRIQWYKRFELAIDAFRSMKKKGFKLKIVGGVSEKDKPVLEFLQNRAEGLDVEFIVGPSDKEMRELYSDCYAYLFTAKDEDWGIVPIEAMASGKPVISVDEGGPRESIVNGETGFLVRADADVFAERMDYLARHPQVARTMGNKAKRHAAKYDWKNFVTRYDKYIEKVTVSGTALL